MIRSIPMTNVRSLLENRSPIYIDRLYCPYQEQHGRSQAYSGERGRFQEGAGMHCNKDFGQYVLLLDL